MGYLLVEQAGESDQHGASLHVRTHATLLQDTQSPPAQTLGSLDVALIRELDGRFGEFNDASHRK